MRARACVCVAAGAPDLRQEVMGDGDQELVQSLIAMYETMLP